MNRWTFKDFSVTLTMEETAKALHVLEDDLEEFEEVFDAVSPLIEPVLYYGEENILANDGHQVTIGDQTFESRILSVNLKDCIRVFPYVVTSGRKAYEFASGYKDDLYHFWAHGICEIALKLTMQQAFEKIKAHLKTRALNAMNPGSLADFPICNQKPLFDLLGNVEEETGITLTPTFLMVPVKSGSGLLYESEKHYQNCMLCPRTDCPNRRAPYDPNKFENEYGE